MLPITLGDSGMKTKGECAVERYPNETYDAALPQSWVDYCFTNGVDPRPHFVWLYDSVLGRPAPITPEGDKMLEQLTP